MLELGVGADILRGIGWLYVALAFGALYLVIRHVEGWLLKALGIALVAGVFSYVPAKGAWDAKRQREKYQAAKALFDERCKMAGEKIYKTVEDVDGVLLKGTRLLTPLTSSAAGGVKDPLLLAELARNRSWRDPNWTGAGFPGESVGIDYIMELLYYSKPAEGNYGRSLGPEPGGLRGYRYVEVNEDGVRIRYTLRDASKYTRGSDPVKGYGIREIATGASARYVIAYENIDDRLGRQNWIAGGRVVVVDQINGELLGEFVRYAFEPGFGNINGGRSPWAFAMQCPRTTHGGSSGHIRSFVEQVLKPKQWE